MDPSLKRSGRRIRSPKALLVALRADVHARCTARLTELGYEMLSVGHFEAAKTRLAIVDADLVIVPKEARPDELASLDAVARQAGAHLVAVPSEDPIAVLDLLVSAMAAFGS